MTERTRPNAGSKPVEVAITGDRQGDRLVRVSPIDGRLPMAIPTWEHDLGANPARARQTGTLVLQDERKAVGDGTTVPLYAWSALEQPGPWVEVRRG